MATFSAIFQPGARHATQTTVTSGASVTITLGPNVIFAIQATGAFNLAFGNTADGGGVPAATGTDWPQAGTAISEWDTGNQFTSISVFNPGAGSIVVTTWPLSRN